MKWFNSQFDKSKPIIKNATEVTLKLSSNMVGDSGCDTNIPHNLLLTDRQVLKFCIKLSKTQLSKSSGFPW